MERGDVTEGLPFNLQGYLSLVDWSGRAVREGKRGMIEARVLLMRDVLGVAADEWWPTVTALQRRFDLVMGSPRQMRQRALAAGRSFYRGCRIAERFYRRA